MEIEKKHDNLAKPDNNNDNDIIYYNMDNKARLDLEIAANAEKDYDKLESEINPEKKEEIVIMEYSDCCQIRSHIHS